MLENARKFHMEANILHSSCLSWSVLLYYCFLHKIRASLYYKTVIIEKNLLPLACNFIKRETLTQVFSCKFCEIFKNTCFTEQVNCFWNFFLEMYIVLILRLDRLEISKISHSQVFFKIGVLECFPKFVVKLLYWSFYLTKLY